MHPTRTGKGEKVEHNGPMIAKGEVPHIQQRKKIWKGILNGKKKSSCKLFDSMPAPSESSRELQEKEKKKNRYGEIIARNIGGKRRF